MALLISVVCSIGSGALSHDGLAWGTDQRHTFLTEGGEQQVVTAGFGFQVGETSRIVIKTYDPHTGTVLSKETFDLAVHEEGSSPSDDVAERIFAGGVGVDAAGLSKFLLRVYDASTGRFLWEGQLNLTDHREEDSATPIATLTPSVARARQTAMTGEAEVVDAYFLVRGLDIATGGLLWEDQFVPDGQRQARIERLSGRLSPGGASKQARAFDFVVRSYSPIKGMLLWQDAFEPIEPEDETVSDDTDQPTVLPMWPRVDEDTTGSLIEWNKASPRIKSCRI
ncbi:MAG: hypothetical protein ACT4OO_10355 [Nitrospiraceae bacterium]